MNLRPALVPHARYALFFVTGSLVVALAVQTDRYERDFVTRTLDWKSIALVFSTVVFLASAFAFVSRRLLASIAVACGLMVLLTVVSVVKFQYLRASLHALDFYYYARPTEVMFLSENFPKIFFPSLAIIVAACGIIWLLFLVDDTRVSRKHNAVALVVAALMITGSFEWQGQRSKIYHFTGLYHVSSAVASAPEAMGIFWRGGFLEGADRGGTINSDPVPVLQNATPDKPPPTLITILHESTFPVGLYPVQCGGPVLKSLYESSNGQRYDLRVETFGGATWLTEYGLQLGISTYYFGEARSFIGYSMQNRVHDGLAMQLHRDGYETIALYPSPQSFVNTGRFYKSLGFDKIFDYYDMHETTELERDRFYYAKAIDQIRAHKASGSTKPLYLDLWTMTSHAPYDYVSHPNVKPEPGKVCGKSKVWAEYLRRMVMAQDDLEWFQEQLKTEFPGQPFMILGFGDHQPFIAKEFLEPSRANPVVPEKNTIGYKTFFRITGVNFEPDFSVVPKSVDTPFLGNVLMLAARLPRHGYYNDRDKLMLMCKGRYNDCPRQDEILSFHERLINSSTIVNR